MDSSNIFNTACQNDLLIYLWIGLCYTVERIAQLFSELAFLAFHSLSLLFLYMYYDLSSSLMRTLLHWHYFGPWLVRE